jgi:heme/copper-type cytochrome/quinol oxidase subunit 3
MYYEEGMGNKRYLASETQMYHLVNPSPWPVAVSVSALNLTIGFLVWFHGYEAAGAVAMLAGTCQGYFAFRWLRDVVSETAYEGEHSKKVLQNLKYGMVLFIVSEVMLFFSFFAAFFYYGTNPSVWFGGVWPAKGVVALHPGTFALGNTVLLLSSSVSATWAHYEIIGSNRRFFVEAIALTVFFAVLFLYFQYTEYKYAAFHINDSVYGSIFFMVTGFHGFHVFVGTVFLCICASRAWYAKQTTFTKHQHFGFVAALWYWHFVDVIWLAVFFVLYVWGSWLAWGSVCRLVLPYFFN